jgi:hypothetical protein
LFTTPRLKSGAADAADESWPVLQVVDEYLTLNTHMQTAVNTFGCHLLFCHCSRRRSKGRRAEIVEYW